MEITEPKRNPETGELETSITNINDLEIIWLRSAVKHSQDLGDKDDPERIKLAKKWLETVHSGFKLLRPS